MADFMIPKGKDYSFTIKVLQKDSILPQDLTFLATAEIEVFKLVDQCSVFTSTLTSTGDDQVNGLLHGEFTAVQTALLEISRGPAEDGYYLKPGYQATLAITFSDDTLPISVMIDRIYATPEGVVCV